MKPNTSTSSQLNQSQIGSMLFLLRVLLKRVFKVANLAGSGVAMLSKQGSRSSLRASLKALFPSKSQTSLYLDFGDAQDSPSDQKTEQTDGDSSCIWINEDEVNRRKDTCASEDGASINSRDTTPSKTECRDANLSLCSRCRQTSFIEETKDAVFNRSGYPDVLDEGKVAKDSKSEADTVSVTGTIDSRIDDLSPDKAKPCCGI